MTAKHIVVATGSKSAPLRGVDVDGVKIGTSTEALAYSEVPKRLAVIGAGVVVGFGPYRPMLEALAPPRTLFTGPLEHRHLVHLLPLADATVVPSVFPEAFGMVAAEAAAAGSPPLVARHSGLAEVAAGLEQGYPERFRHLASFEPGNVNDLARKLAELVELPTGEREALGSAARSVVLERWSWGSVAARLLAPV